MTRYALLIYIELWSKIHKNENDTHIPLYQIYLPKLHENKLKHYRLNLFKEIAIGLNNGLLTTSESFASLSDGLLV